MSSSMPTPPRRPCGWRLRRDRSLWRFATTAMGSTQGRHIPVTSDWTRCAAVQPRSAGDSQSRAHPASAPSSESGSRRRPMEPDAGLAPDENICVLVVDDHELVRRGLLAFLDSEPDIDVVGEAGGGAEALDLLASLESDGGLPDVVVMDLQMA